ncbi:endolysin, partial [Klebsiella phage vB_Kpn-VAC111]
TIATRKLVRWKNRAACIIAGFRNINYALRI